MDLFVKMMLCVCVFGLLTATFLLIKNSSTLKNQTKVLDALHKYNTYIIRNKDQCDWEEMIIDYDCIEDYEKTFCRVWDWGVTRIVPKDVYDKIKEYF